MSNLQPAKPPLLTRARALALPLLVDVVGLVGYGLVVRGVFLNWGAGWALIAAGLPLAAGYVLYELTPRQQAPRGD